MPKSSFTLALAADKGTHMLTDHARYRDAYLHLSNVELARVIHNHPNAAAGLARLQADIDAHAGDVAEVGMRMIPVTSLDDSDLVTRISCGYADDEVDEREKRDRLIILPERGDVTEGERADWDRDNEGDRFE